MDISTLLNEVKESFSGVRYSWSSYTPDDVTFYYGSEEYIVENAKTKLAFGSLTVDGLIEEIERAFSISRVVQYAEEQSSMEIALEQLNRHISGSF